MGMKDVDCIDRNSIKYYLGTGGYMYASKGEIDKLPSVTPQEQLYVWLALAPALEVKRFCETAGYCVEFFGDHEYRMYKER